MQVQEQLKLSTKKAKLATEHVVRLQRETKNQETRASTAIETRLKEAMTAQRMAETETELFRSAATESENKLSIEKDNGEKRKGELEAARSTARDAQEQLAAERRERMQLAKQLEDRGQALQALRAELNKARLDHAKHTAGRYSSGGDISRGEMSVGEGQVTNPRLTRQQKDIEKHTARMVKSKSMREPETMMKAESDNKKSRKRGLRRAATVASRAASAPSSTFNSTGDPGEPEWS